MGKKVNLSAFSKALKQSPAVGLVLLAYKRDFSDGLKPTPLHLAVLRALPPDVFIQNIKANFGDSPELDPCLDVKLGEFPPPICHPYILARFSSIGIEKLKILALGRTPVEILCDITRFTHTVTNFDMDYFEGLNLSKSPKLQNILTK